MIVLTKDQWAKKIKSVIPSWVSSDRGASALINGIAAAMAEQNKIFKDHIESTYIDTGLDDYVALHGAERSVSRLNTETLSGYRQRVKNITNQSSIPALKMIVDALLIRGQCTIIEHHEATNFLNDGSFLNRNIIDYQVLYNAFTILIDYQIPEPTSFFNCGSFLDREFLNGSKTSSDEVFYNVIEAVNKNKAFGTVYRLIERANP